MAYEIDVLIAYADADNHSTESNNGWIEDFKKFLELMLVQVLGSDTNVLLKSEHDHIAGANMKKAAILIPVLSPTFVESGECLDTLEDFFKTVEKDHPTRVFKVLKKPLSQSEQPTKLRELLGYELFNLNMDTGEVTDYTNFFTVEAERDFWMKMVDLAYDIHESLLAVKYKDKKSDTKSIYARRSIYLAETGHDLVIQKNIIKRELQRHGYRVLPDHTLPHDLGELRKIVEKVIEECSFSIHLIGSSYGEIPQGSDQSVVDIQNQLATEKNSRVKNKAEFTRLVWISPQLDKASEKQLAFIESIKRDMSSSEGVEILQTPLEDFKNIVRGELIEGRGDKHLLGTLGDVKSNAPRVYVLHDKADMKEVASVKKYIEDEGYTVLTPTFEGELLDLRRHHIENLREFDAAIIFQGKMNHQWVRMKLLDLLKAPGFGRKKPIQGKAIINSQPQEILPAIYESADITLIRNVETESLDSQLKSFLEDLKVTA
ncbi:MAG: hypothetical protein MJA30_32225 [Cytophagales bacterium]|nr:hypothetical protein [Cytophagales bacterium]